MVWGRHVIKAHLLLKLTSQLFLEGHKMYCLCEGLHRTKLKSLSLKTSWRLCKGTSPVAKDANT